MNQRISFQVLSTHDAFLRVGESDITQKGDENCAAHAYDITNAALL
jgi:hypothetical protein